MSAWLCLYLKKRDVEKHIESRTHSAGKEMRKSDYYLQQRVAKIWYDYVKRHGNDLSGLASRQQFHYNRV